MNEACSFCCEEYPEEELEWCEYCGEPFCKDCKSGDAADDGKTVCVYCYERMEDEGDEE